MSNYRFRSWLYTLSNKFPIDNIIVNPLESNLNFLTDQRLLAMINPWIPMIVSLSLYTILDLVILKFVYGLTSNFIVSSDLVLGTIFLSRLMARLWNIPKIISYQFSKAKKSLYVKIFSPLSSLIKAILLIEILWGLTILINMGDPSQMTTFFFLIGIEVILIGLETHRLDEQTNNFTEINFTRFLIDFEDIFIGTIKSMPVLIVFLPFLIWFSFIPILNIAVFLVIIFIASLLIKYLMIPEVCYLDPVNKIIISKQFLFSKDKLHRKPMNQFVEFKHYFQQVKAVAVINEKRSYQEYRKYLKYCYQTQGKSFPKWLDLGLQMMIDSASKQYKVALLLSLQGQDLYLPLSLQSHSNQTKLEKLAKKIKKILNTEEEINLTPSESEIVTIDIDASPETPIKPRQPVHNKEIINIPLSKQNLTNRDFSYHDLSNASFRYSNLTNANFSEANLNDANFSNTNLRNVNFKNAQLNHANFYDAKLNNGNFTNANLSHAEITGKPSLIDTTFHNANLSNATIRNAKCNSNTNFSYADLRDAELSNLSLNNVDLRYAHMSHTYFYQVQLKGANLSHADLSHADLSNLNLSYADLSYADLSHAKLDHTNLNNANLSHANLSNAYFYDTNLSHANLSNADLSQATLSNVSLDHAILDGAKLPENYSQK